MRQIINIICRQYPTCHWGRESFSERLGRAGRAGGREGGHTSPTSQEQWAAFSWITVASSPLPSHWSTLPHHWPGQEAVTNRNDISTQSGGLVLKWLTFDVTFYEKLVYVTMSQVIQMEIYSDPTVTHILSSWTRSLWVVLWTPCHFTQWAVKLFIHWRRSTTWTGVEKTSK